MTSASAEHLRAALADRYRIERKLGQGGMATVYLAYDLRHERQVAIKVLRADLAAAIGAERFLREIKTIAPLQHPHILGLIDSGEVAGTAYYVMPFVDGESLRERLLRERQLPIAEAIRIASDVAAALDYAHRHGVIHRDIKPENVLLHEGEVMLADFGIALAVKEAGGSRLTETGLSLGTPQYMSPEQATGERTLDARTDVYSLAAMLYEMLAGEPPFTGPTAQAVIAKLMTERPTRLRVVRDTVPESVDIAVAKALAKVPADRFASTGAFATALSLVSATGAPRARQRWRLIGTLAVVTALVAGGALVARRPGSTTPGGERSAIAILPFAVRGNPALDYLGEGVVELLSTKLDRVGDLRAVDPRALLSAVRDRSGQLGPDDARAVAAGFGATRYVLGSVIQLGDSVRLSAALYDSQGKLQVSAEAVGREAEFGRALDDVARLLLGRMSTTPADRLESIGAITTASFPALRAYLDGQKAFRANDLDSAVTAFRRATELDTAFALAWYRLATAAVWNDQDSLWYRAMDEAVRHEERLSARDRALLEAQHAWRRGRVAEAERLYDAIVSAHPDDQEAWFWLGDVRLHTNFLRGRPLAEAEPALRRALALDPRDWQARGHLEGLLRRTERPAAADSIDTPPDTTSFVNAFVRRELPGAAERQAAILRAPAPRGLYILASFLLQAGFDPPTGLRLARMLADGTGSKEWRAHGHLMLGCEQLAAGRWSAADAEFATAERLFPDYGLPYRAIFAVTSPVRVPDSTLRGLTQRLRTWDVTPRDSGRVGVEAQLTQLSPSAALDDGRTLMRQFLIGLLDLRLGDTSSAAHLSRVLDAEVDSESLGSLAHDYAATIEASLAAVRGDHAATLRALETQRFIIMNYRFIWPFQSHGTARLLRASALAQAGRDEEALGWLDGLMTTELSVLDRQFLRAPAYRLAGEIYDRRGDRESALRAYGRFVTLWRDGDSSAQEQVKAVRERMAALAADD